MLNFSAVSLPYLWFLLLAVVRISSVTHPRVSSNPWFHRRWDGHCSSQLTIFLICNHASRILISWSLVGKVSPKRSINELSPVKISNRSRFKPISSLLSNWHRFLDRGSHIFMKIWLVFFLSPVDIYSFSPSLKEQADGQKQFLSSLQQ